MQSTNQYQVISIDFMVSRKRALEELTQEVNKAILSGWEPLGWRRDSRRDRRAGPREAALRNERRIPGMTTTIITHAAAVFEPAQDPRLVRLLPLGAILSVEIARHRPTGRNVVVVPHVEP